VSDRGFLTEKNRDVLFGRYDGSENARRNHKTRIKSKTAGSLNDLIAVADTGTIENEEDVFDPDQVYALLVALTIDRDTFGSDDPNDPHQKEIDPEFRRKILEAVEAFRRTYYEGYGPGEPAKIE
jgi:hypothetical protein